VVAGQDIPEGAIVTFYTGVLYQAGTRSCPDEGNNYAFQITLKGQKKKKYLDARYLGNVSDFLLVILIVLNHHP
jgi:hypothetical protein